MILVSSLYFGWIARLIYVGPLVDPVENLKQMAMPAIALALPLMGVVMRNRGPASRSSTS
jgi:hypothetical protein